MSSEATSSVIRVHTLLDGSLRQAGRAATAAVVELAIDGHLTIAPDDDCYQSVLLVRTDKPMDDLCPEQVMLLEALFGAGAKVGTAMYLRHGHQLPVAQTIMAATRERLLQDGLITSRKPQDLYRKLRRGFNLSCVAALVIVAVSSRSFGFVALTAIIAVVVNAFFSALVTDRLKYRRVNRTLESDRAVEKLKELRTHLVAGGLPTGLITGDIPLPYEILWYRFRRPESLKHVTPEPPSWWAGHDWPNEASCIPELLWVIETALNQRKLADGSGFEPTPPERFSYIAWLDEQGDRILDAQDAVEAIGSLDLSDWGGDGHGDSGDGGHGDGGHGDSGGHG